MRVIHFNLIPYRLALEARARRLFWLQMLLALVCAVIFCLGVSSWLDGRLAEKDQFIYRIDDAKRSLAASADKAAALEAEKNAIQAKVSALVQVHLNTVAVSEIFSTLDTTLPQDVFMQEMKRQGDNLVIRGLTQNIPLLTQWVQGLQARTDIFSQVDFDVVERIKVADGLTDYSHEFVVSLKLAKPKMPAQMRLTKEVVHAGY
ncbi:MAG: hypothetical protein HC848_01215 [Limnobacter sp.]|nr:hypothetical protein [Limnobacter sp.]